MSLFALKHKFLYGSLLILCSFIFLICVQFKYENNSTPKQHTNDVGNNKLKGNIKLIGNNKLIENMKLIENNKLIENMKLIGNNKLLESNKLTGNNKLIGNNKLLENNKLIGNNKLLENDKLLDIIFDEPYTSNIISERRQMRHINRPHVRKNSNSSQRGEEVNVSSILSETQLEIANYHIVQDNHINYRIKNNFTFNKVDINQESSTNQDKIVGRKSSKPNFILFLFDDSGFGDLGANHAPMISSSPTSSPSSTSTSMSSHSSTPFLDLIASKGIRLTSFYVLASTCTPSRAGILTGRYGMRTGIIKHIPPYLAGGLPRKEMTIATHLKKQGYKSIVLGKWHLGHVEPYDPISHGFDEWIGLPFSNDMACTDGPLGVMKSNMGACPKMTGPYDRSNPWTKAKSKYNEPPVLPLYHACLTSSIINSTSSATSRRLHARCEKAVQITVQDIHVKKCKTNISSNPTSIGDISESIREQPTDLWRLSDRLVYRATTFIRENTKPIQTSNTTAAASSSTNEEDVPFFLYFPLIHTHVPHTPKIKYLLQSLKTLKLESEIPNMKTEKDYSDYIIKRRNIKNTQQYDSIGSLSYQPSNIEKATYGAALREADDMVKQVMESLQDTQQYENTLTVIMSDNGPWMEQNMMGGSPLPFRGGKFTMYEGGVRMFCLFHWPKVLGGHIHQHRDIQGGGSSSSSSSSSNKKRGDIIASSAGGVTSDYLISSLDLLPTFVSLSQGQLPHDRSFDGSDLSDFIYHVGKFRLLYNHEDDTSSSFKQASEKLQSRVFKPRSIIVQSMGALTTLRIGKYKVYGLESVNMGKQQKSKLQVFNLDEDHTEMKPLSDSTTFILPKPIHHSSSDVLEEEMINLTLEEFTGIVLYIRNYVINDIQTTYRTPNAHNKAPQASKMQPCAGSGNDNKFKPGYMCVKCPCKSSLNISPLSGKKDILARNC